jgi:hypothetical protein
MVCVAYNGTTSRYHNDGDWAPNYRSSNFPMKDVLFPDGDPNNGADYGLPITPVQIPLADRQKAIQEALTLCRDQTGSHLSVTPACSAEGATK